MKDKKENNKIDIFLWVKKHSTQLLLAGISITTIFTALKLKNKDSVSELLTALKKQIKEKPLYTPKWFEKANLEDLENARKLVHQDFLNPKLDDDYRNHCRNLLNRLDFAINKIKWAGKEYDYPVHGSNGWYLTSD